MSNRLKNININSKETFAWSVHALNSCFGRNNKRWMRAWCKLSETEAVWFPKLAVMDGGIPTAQDKVYGCINTLSADGTEIRERHSIACGTTEQIYRYVFAKADKSAPYKYIGTFMMDLEKCTPDEAVYKRVATEIDLSPWYSETDWTI